MNRRMVAVVVVSATLSFGLAPLANAAEAQSPKSPAGWLDRVVEWIVEVWKEDTSVPAAPGGAGGVMGLDGGGCLDPSGRPLCG
jgi:hypothetical protein